MDAVAIAEMLRKDRHEWRKLATMLEAHPDEPLHDPNSPTWTSRDIYAHLARWMERTTEQLKAELAGQPLPPIPGTDDEINARWQAEDSHLSLEQAREWAQQAFDHRIRAIESVPGDQWNDTREAIARGDGDEHYAAHLSYILVK